MSLKNEIKDILKEEKPHPPMAPKKVPKVEDEPFKAMQEVAIERLNPPKHVNQMDLVLQNLGMLNTKFDEILRIMTIDWDSVEEGLYRARSTIKNKDQVKKGEGKYARDFENWGQAIEGVKNIKKQLNTPLLNEMRNESDLFKSQAKKNNPEERELNG